MLRHIQNQCKNYKAKLAAEDPKQVCLVKLKQTQMSSFATKDGSESGGSIGLGCFNEEETRKPGFQEFCRAGMPLFDIPSRRTIVRDIMQLYFDEKASLIKLLERVR
ncbi:hypothetical protein ACOSQ3_004377 [Xanthoceras sorbifolium]